MAYLDLDLKEHVFTDLEEVPQLLTRIHKKPAGLKWVILAIDSALYHAMILALQNTDCSGVWMKPEPRFPNGDINMFDPKAKLIGFHDALSWVQERARMSGYVGAQPLSISAGAIERLKELHEMRNDIVHHLPVSWTISAVPVMAYVLDALPIIDFLLLKSGRVGLIEEEVARLRAAVSRTRAVIAANPDHQAFQKAQQQPKA